MDDSSFEKKCDRSADDNRSALDAYLDALQKGILIDEMSDEDIITMLVAEFSNSIAEGEAEDEISARDSAFAHLAPTFIPYKDTDIRELPVPLSNETMRLGLNSQEYQKTILDFVGFCDTDTSAIFRYAESTRFCDVPAFASFDFPHVGAYGKEEYLEILLTNSIDVLLSNSASITDFDESIFALSVTLASANASWEFDTKKLAVRITESLPLGLYHARISWILDHPMLRQANRTFADVLKSNNLSVGELYLADKAAAMYRFSIYNQLATQEEFAGALYCGAVTESIQKPNPLTVDVIGGRNALLGAGKQTLDELGKVFGLTRERIRQIESKAIKSFAFGASKRMLSWRIAVVGTAMKNGFGGYLGECEEGLKEIPLFYQDESFSSLLKLTPDITVDKKGDGYYLSHLPCVGCTSVRDFALSLDESNGCIEIKNLPDVIRCCEADIYEVPQPLTLAIILRDVYGLHVAGSLLGSQHNKTVSAMRNPKSIANQIRVVMHENEQAISAEKVSAIVSERTGKHISKNHVLSTLSRPEFNCLLWDTSTYILRDYAPYPEELLKNITASLPGLFADRNIPILGVNGIYDMYSSELIAEGIAHPQALYSLLRIIGDEHLLLKEYPWICDSQTIGERTSFSKYFTSVVERNNGFISDEHADRLEERAMAQKWQLDGLSIYSPFLMHANGGWYSLEVMGLDYGAIERVVDDVAAEMQEGELVSAKKIFSDNESLFARSGVKSFDILYRAIDLMDGLPLKASRIPHLVKSDTRGQQVSVREAIRSFIVRKKGLCSQEDLFEEFVIKGGIARQALSPAIFLGDGIFEIDDQVYCTDESLNLSLSYADEFDHALREILGKTSPVGGIFFTSRLVENQISDLPRIIGFEMTKKLLKHLFALSEEYSLFGHNRNCIVCRKDHPEITNDEEFYAAIVEQFFGGWATFDDFSEFCKTYDIINKLAPEFFDAYGLLEASEYSIRLE